MPKPSELGYEMLRICRSLNPKIPLKFKTKDLVENDKYLVIYVCPDCLAYKQKRKVGMQQWKQISSHLAKTERALNSSNSSM